MHTYKNKVYQNIEITIQFKLTLKQSKILHKIYLKLREFAFTNHEKSILKVDHLNENKQVFLKRKQFVLTDLKPNKYRLIDEDFANTFFSYIMLQHHTQRASTKMLMILTV